MPVSAGGVCVVSLEFVFVSAGGVESVGGGDGGVSESGGGAVVVSVEVLVKLAVTSGCGGAWSV